MTVSMEKSEKHIEDLKISRHTAEIVSKPALNERIKFENVNIRF